MAPTSLVFGCTLALATLALASAFTKWSLAWSLALGPKTRSALVAVRLLSLIAGSYALTNVFLTSHSKASLDLEPEVIYGTDNRYDVYDARADRRLAAISRSTGLITYREQIADTFNPHLKSFATKSLLDEKNLCEDEPFAKQPVGGWCSGFLAAPDIFVTAGHCVPSAARCGQIAIVFGFAYEAGAEDLNQLNADDVYSCKNIIAQKYDRPRGQDFAVLRLDRPVRGRTPLPLRRTGKLEGNAILAVIGHPAGLPTKIADGAYVRDNSSSDYFITNTDSFNGSSGSAVLNARTGLVEGILVRGERDFDYRGDCMVSYRCQDASCRGEDAVRASAFAPHIPATPGNPGVDSPSLAPHPPHAPPGARPRYEPPTPPSRYPLLRPGAGQPRYTPQAPPSRRAPYRWETHRARPPAHHYAPQPRQPR